MLLTPQPDSARARIIAGKGRGGIRAKATAKRDMGIFSGKSMRRRLSSNPSRRIHRVGIAALLHSDHTVPIDPRDRWFGLDRVATFFGRGPWRQGRLRRRAAVKTLDAMVRVQILSSTRFRPCSGPQMWSGHFEEQIGTRAPLRVLPSPP